MIKEIGFTYSDIRTLTRVDRAEFIKLYIKEMERAEDASKRQQSHRSS